jgi:hypothetical protein
MVEGKGFAFHSSSVFKIAVLVDAGMNFTEGISRSR